MWGWGGGSWVEMGWGNGEGSGWSLPSSLSPPLHWRRNILDYHGQSPLVEGQLGFPLERQEIMASRGGEKCGKYMGGLFTIVSALEA